jgi:hypothetical protein
MAGAGLGGGFDLGSLFGDITNIIGSVSTHTKYGKQLDEIAQSLKIPAGVLIAQGILKGKANEGISGYQDMLSQVDANKAVTMNQAKDFLTSGDMLSLLAKVNSSSEESKRNLGFANAEAQKSNLGAYANFEGTTMAKAQQDLADKKTQLQIAGAENAANETSDIFKNVSAIAGNIGDSGMQYLNDFAKAKALKKATGSDLPAGQMTNLLELFGGDGDVLNRIMELTGKQQNDQKNAWMKK